MLLLPSFINTHLGPLTWEYMKLYPVAKPHNLSLRQVNQKMKGRKRKTRVSPIFCRLLGYVALLRVLACLTRPYLFFRRFLIAFHKKRKSKGSLKTKEKSDKSSQNSLDCLPYAMCLWECFMSECELLLFVFRLLSLFFIFPKPFPLSFDPNTTKEVICKLTKNLWSRHQIRGEESWLLRNSSQIAHFRGYFRLEN